jgi:hypothetical protein
MRFVMSCVSLCLVLATSPLFCFLRTEDAQSALQETATKAGKSLVVQEVGETSQVIAPQVLSDGGGDASLTSFPSIEGEDFAEPTFLETLKQRFGEVAWGEHGKMIALKTGKFLGHSAAIVGSSAFNLVWRTLCVGGRFAKDTFDLFARGKINPPQCLDGRWALFGKYEPLSWSPQAMPDDVAFRDEAVNAMKIGVVSLTPLANLVLNALNVVGETAWSLGGDVYRAVKQGEVAKPNLVKKLFSAEA